MHWKEPVARAGLVAKGGIYGIIGLLALKLAVGAGGAATSNQGALQHLAGSTFGTVLIVLLAIGLAAYAVWRASQAWDGDEVAERIVNGARFLVYVAMGSAGIGLICFIKGLLAHF